MPERKRRCFFFNNSGCEYFPCHDWPGDRADFNCMGCYCPLYGCGDCGGDWVLVRTRSGDAVKDCSACLLPHENFEGIVERLKNSADTL